MGVVILSVTWWEGDVLGVVHNKILTKIIHNKMLKLVVLLPVESTPGLLILVRSPV